MSFYGAACHASSTAAGIRPRSEMVYPLSLAHCRTTCESAAVVADRVDRGPARRPPTLVAALMNGSSAFSSLAEVLRAEVNLVVDAIEGEADGSTTGANLMAIEIVHQGHRETILFLSARLVGEVVEI